MRGSRIPGRPLQRQFRRVLTYKQRNRYNISLVGLGRPTLRARTSQVEIRDIRGAVRGFRVKRDRPNLFSVIRNLKKIKFVNRE